LTTTNGTNPTVYTVYEVAQILRIGKISVYQAIGRGDVPSIRIGRRILIPRAALEVLLNAGAKFKQNGRDGANRASA
jgi:excisionase family DNA binding protein